MPETFTCVLCDDIIDGRKHGEAILMPSDDEESTYHHLDCGRDAGCELCINALNLESES